MAALVGQPVEPRERHGICQSAGAGLDGVDQAGDDAVAAGRFTASAKATLEQGQEFIEAVLGDLALRTNCSPGPASR